MEIKKEQKAYEPRVNEECLDEGNFDPSHMALNWLYPNSGDRGAWEIPSAHPVMLQADLIIDIS